MGLAVDVEMKDATLNFFRRYAAARHMGEKEVVSTVLDEFALSVTEQLSREERDRLLSF